MKKGGGMSKKVAYECAWKRCMNEIPGLLLPGRACSTACQGKTGGAFSTKAKKKVKGCLPKAKSRLKKRIKARVFTDVSCCFGGGYKLVEEKYNRQGTL